MLETWKMNVKCIHHFGIIQEHKLQHNFVYKNIQLFNIVVFAAFMAVIISPFTAASIA